MSEYKEIVTICDRCHPDFLPGFAFFPVEAVKGIFRGYKADALHKGWEERDYGDICPNCAKMEADEAGDGEVVLGQAALESVTGASDES